MRLSQDWTTVSVAAIRDLTPSIREFTLAAPAGMGTYPTGSHLQVRVMIDGQPDVRHYSLVGEHPVDGSWRIAVKREQPGRGGSRYMWSLPAGARLEAAAPDSHFELSRDAGDYLLIAAGIGITPIRGMASALRRRGVPFRLLYAGRSRGEMAYVAELERELGDRLTVLTDDTGGRLDLPAAFASLAAEGEAYVCGPIGVLEAARRAWQEAGRPRARLIYETFGSSGRYASEAFVVHVPRLGKQVTVSADTTMLVALEQAGVRVLADCRRGECGLCVVDVLQCTGVIDHRDVFFSSAQHAENKKLCACVSRVSGGEVTIDPAYRGDRVS